MLRWANMPAKLPTPPATAAAAAPSAAVASVGKTAAGKKTFAKKAARRGTTKLAAPCTTCKASCVCGPDITKQLAEAVKRTKANFKTWTTAQKDASCLSLVNPFGSGYNNAAVSWDIEELHDDNWTLTYRPDCATKGCKPPCGQTVQVDDQCFYRGSPNYVIFGVMCKLCAKHKAATGGNSAVYSSGAMQALINLYKPTSKNRATSQAWAQAGYDDWPVAATPTGDRNSCKPTCTKPYRDGPFIIRFGPNYI